MNILLVTNFADIGGGERNLINLALELSKSHSITVSCPKGKLWDSLSSYNIKLKEFLFRSKFTPFTNIKDFAEYLRFDVIHLYNNTLLINFSFLSLLGKKIVITNHGPWENYSRIRSFIIKLLINKCICITDEIFDLNRLPSNMKCIIPLGCPPSIFNSTSVSSRPIFNIACIARYQYIKGQDVLLDALKLLDTSLNSKVKIIFVGNINKSDLNDHLYATIILNRLKDKFNNIEIEVQDFKNDISDIYILSDLIVVPSRYESFSMVTIEALNFGKPVVGPNCGGPKYIVNSERIGLLFNPGDAFDLSRKMLSAISNNNFSPDSCLSRGLEFSIVQQVKLTLDVYHSLV